MDTVAMEHSQDVGVKVKGFLKWTQKIYCKGKHKLMV